MSFLTAVGESLVQKGCAVREKGGILGGKNVYIPDEKELDTVVQNIRAELLEEGELSEDIVALTALLEKSGDLMRYFSAYEKKSIRSRLKEIKESPQSEMIQKVAEYIDTLFMMFIVAGNLTKEERIMSRQREAWRRFSPPEYVTLGELVRLTGARYSTLKFIPKRIPAL